MGGHKGDFFSLCAECVEAVFKLPKWDVTPVEAAKPVCERCGKQIRDGVEDFPIGYTQWLASLEKAAGRPVVPKVVPLQVSN